MSLHKAMMKEQEVLFKKCGADPIPQEVIDKYRRELDDDRERYEVEERARIVRTHQLAITTVVA